MIVEIGTCDFETQAGVEAGLFVEPVRYYFERLPATCWKENVAVSNYAGVIDVYYVAPDAITAHGLPDWLRGCNSVGRPHPRHAEVPISFLRMDTVRVVRIATLLDKYQITHLDTLKIDTEGHDAVILHDFLDTCDLLPRNIYFENNGLVPAADVVSVSARLTARGYVVRQTPGECWAARLV